MNRRVVHIVLLLSAFACVALGACAAFDGTPHSVRVVVWNIHHGAGLDGRVDVPRIAAVLAALEADFVLLQEVDVGCRRSGGVDIPVELAGALSMHAAFAENIPFQGGSYGNAILSRWPIEQQSNLHYEMLRDGEQRGLLTVRVATPSGPLAIGCTHIDYRPDDSERMLNAGQILATMRERGLFAIGGDFNDLPDSRVHRELCRDLIDCFREANGDAPGPSYPADAPTRRIDWLLRAPDGPWRTTAARVVPTEASDHRAVVFDLERTRS